MEPQTAAHMRRALARGLARWRDDPRRWYAPHGRQMAFHAAGTEARERLFLAGNRVGKTLAGAVEVGFHLTGLYPAWWQGVRFNRPVRAWAASVTQEATRDILQVTYMGGPGQVGVIPAWLVRRVTLKKGVTGGVDEVHVRHASGGISVLGFKSYDQGRRSFQGTVRDVVHLDEEPDIGIYEECLLRTLTVGGHMLLTMTPLMGLTDMVRHFTDAVHHEGKAVVQAGWGDAPHLDAGEVDRLRVSLRPHERAAREHGEPSLGSGRVYPIDETALAVARFEVPPHWRRCVGVDFGWSNPTAAVWLAHDPVGDIVYVTDVYWARERVPAEHAEAILARGRGIAAVCDPAGQAVGQKDGVSLIQLYEAAGVFFQLADNAVEAGVMAVLDRMQRGTLKVFADVDAWWREFRVYARDAKGRIIKRDDHLMDATRYALVSGLPLARSGEGSLARPTLRRGDWRIV